MNKTVELGGPRASALEVTEKALRLAVNMLSQYEPPDSRAVSDEFVALAAVSCGIANADAVRIIDAALQASEAGGPSPTFDGGPK